MNAEITKYWPHFMRNYVWLIKRELWEHRGRLLITPLVVAGVILAGAFFGLAKFSSEAMHIDSAGIHFNEPGVSGDFLANTGVHITVYMILSLPFFIAMFFVTSYYALDALYADRRDRSILFWKSLPISDVETVVSKLATAGIVAPMIAAGISLATQLVVFSVTSIVLQTHGHDASLIWRAVPVFQNIAMLLYALLVTILWYAPIWAWCLLASAWARRAVFLWAIVPIVALLFLENRTLGTHVVADFLRTRFTGMIPLAVDMPREALQSGQWNPTSPLHLGEFLTPATFFSSAQLWIGLLLAAALVSATVWVRRYREVV